MKAQNDVFVIDDLVDPFLPGRINAAVVLGV